MHDSTMDKGLQAATPVVRRAARPVPTARWVPTVGADGRRRLSMQWSVPGRATAVHGTRAA